MTRFLFCTYGASGHINATMPVAIALKQRGHEVAILTSAKYADAIRNLGLTYIKPHAWEATLKGIKPTSPPRSSLEILSQVQAPMRDVFFHDAPLQAHDLREAIRNWPTDVLVSSNVTFGVSLVAQKEGIPWAMYSLSLTCPLSSPDLPPWGMGAARPRTLIQKLGIRLLNRFVSIMGRSLSQEWNTIRTAEGLPRRNVSLQQNLISPYLYIFPSATAFDFSRTDLPPQVHYVGPSLWQEGKGAVAWENPFKDDKPLVYCTPSTVYNNLDFIRTAVAASAGQEFNLFATLGKNNQPADLGTLPPNVHAASYVPQHLILPQAAAVICNGGSGVVMGTLAAGKPLVVIPQGADHHENARRCLEAGVGNIISPSAYTPQTLRAAILHVVFHNSYRHRAMQLGQVLSALDGPSNAAKLLEQLGKTRQPVTTPLKQLAKTRQLV